MFSSENFSLNYHHKPKNSVTNGFSNQTIPNKPFQTFNSNNLDKMNRSLSGKPNACFDSQIANLWKTGNNEPCVMTAEDIWKFCPINNSGTDYSSLSSASQSPEDHTETFFNVASQLQRQTTPELNLQQQPDYGKLFDVAEPKEFQLKNSLCCQFILNNHCELGSDKCPYAHSIM